MARNPPLSGRGTVTVTFAGSGDAFGSGGRLQACIHVRAPGHPALLLDCGATSMAALKRQGLDPGEIGIVLVSHLHGDHFAGLPFLILDGQFSHRSAALTIGGPPGIARRLGEAMELMFPGSSRTRQRFGLEVAELAPATTTGLAGTSVTAWGADHPSGAPSLALRVEIAGKTIAYTGDTAWTADLPDLAMDADLLIAEAYFWDKSVPHHLRHSDLAAHRGELTSRRTILTHMSADMLGRAGESAFETAYDGLTIRL
jgi:ribonuclease BN (tRNA processing enzyme)